MDEPLDLSHTNRAEWITWCSSQTRHRFLRRPEFQKVLKI